MNFSFRKQKAFNHLLLILLTLIVGGFLFGRIGDAEAADPIGVCYGDGVTLQANVSKVNCWDICHAQNPNPKTCQWKEGADSSLNFNKIDVLTNNVPFVPNNDPTKTKKDICSWGNWFSENFLKCVLLAVLRALGYLMNVAVILFEFIVRPANFLAIVASDPIYAFWKLVRDTLNIAFILVLLFSAFCTVFQITKYNYKALLLNLIIMALLVNFSFPIARFIIDFANSLMYYLLNHMFGNINGPNGTEIFANIANQETGRLATLFKLGVDNDLSFILASLIFIFILTITFLTIAILLIVRAITLAILVIFSPLAFVGTIVPFFAKHSSEWWDNLFKHSFFGPIIIFMLYIATEMIHFINIDKINSFKEIAGTQSASDDANFVAQLAFFTIPIVILWIGIGFAQKSSLAGASMIMGQGQKFGKWLATRPQRGVAWVSKKSGLTGGAQQKWDQWKKGGILGSERQAQREAAIAGWGPFKVPGSKQKDMLKRAKEYKDNNTTIPELETKASNGDAPAAYRLAEDKKLTPEVYNKFMTASKDTASKKEVNGKVKQNRIDIVANNRISNPDEVNKVMKDKGFATTNEAMEHIAREDYANLSPDKWAEQDLSSTLEPYIKNPADPSASRIRNAIADAYYDLDPVATVEVVKRLSGKNRAALQAAGII